MQKSALSVSSFVFSVVAIAHFVRYSLEWDLVIGGMQVPLTASLYAGAALAGLAMWTFAATRRS